MVELEWEERCELAERFAPHLVLFPEKQELGRPGKRSDYSFSRDSRIPRKLSAETGDYHPRGIGPLSERARITSRFLWPQHTVTLEALAASVSSHDQLMVLRRLFPDPDLAWRTYFDILNCIDRTGQVGRERFPVMAYARVQTRAEATAASQYRSNLAKDYSLSVDEVGRPFFQPETACDDDVVMQYWFCYYFDDWANQHEGDWEGISIFMHRTANGYEPLGAGYYAHESGTRRHWTDVERSILGGAQPLVYVAAGSHASYFQHLNDGYVVSIPGKIIPLIKIRLRLLFTSTVNDHVPDRLKHKPIKPKVDVLPDPVGPTNPNDTAWQHKKWLSFPGTWGIRPPLPSAYGGPFGPSHKGLKWDHPFAWMERYCSPDFLVY